MSLKKLYLSWLVGKFRSNDNKSTVNPFVFTVVCNKKQYGIVGYLSVKQMRFFGVKMNVRYIKPNVCIGWKT